MTFDEKEHFWPKMTKSAQKSLFLPKCPKSIGNIVENVRRMHFWQNVTHFNEKVHISPKNAKMIQKSEKLENDGKVPKVLPRSPDVPFALKTNGKIDVLGAILAQSPLLDENS